MIRKALDRLFRRKRPLRLSELPWRTRKGEPSSFYAVLAWHIDGAGGSKLR